MKNSLKKLTLSILLISIMLLQCITASAMRAPLYPGDVDKLTGWNVDLTDVVLVQRYIAHLEELSKKQIYVADVDEDGKVTLEDVTDMQKYIAKIISEFKKDQLYYHYPTYYNYYADFLSGRAMAGVPVHFTVVPGGGPAPFRYQLTVKGKSVCDVQSSNVLEYTFSEAGTYRIQIALYNDFDDVTYREFDYTIVEPYTSDKPMIKTFYSGKENMDTKDKSCTFTAEAHMGEGPYLYRFLLDGKAVTEDFDGKNSFTIDKSLPIGEYTVTIQVKDKNSGDSFESESFDFKVTEPLIG